MSSSPETSQAKPLEVAIIGAGFSGLCMAIKLPQAGITHFQLYEKSNGISGTWHDHTYPGLVCDIPSHLYSFSFDLNPDWSLIFSPQPEIKAYVERCVDKFGIRPQINLNSEVLSSKFDANTALWTIEFADGHRVQAHNIVSGIGGLNRPSIPDFPGKDNFKGLSFHTARWPKDLDFSGKRVAIIGSAASTIQIAPQIAGKVEQLYVFQRTPNWIFPRPEFAFPEWFKWAQRTIPGLTRLHRNLIYLLLDFVAFNGFKKNSVMRNFRQKQAIKFIRKTVKNPELQKKLIPDFPMGCKRVLLSADFYPCLNQENVGLVTEGIERINADSITTKTGETCPVDVIIYATGYQVTNPLGGSEIEGLNGLSLKTYWSKWGLYAHKGVSVNGFPNMFILLGPNTGLGHNSIIFMIEQQVKYALQCIQRLRPNEYMDVREEVITKYNDDLQAEFENTVWTGGCQSWYMDANGRNPTLWPYNCTRYWSMMRKVDFSEYTFAKAKGESEIAHVQDAALEPVAK